MAARERQPLASVGSANSGAWSAAAPFGSPAKLELGEQAQDSISPGSVAQNAARVIEALEAESPPERSRSQNQWAEQPSHNALAVVPASSSPQPAVDTLLIRRLASDVAADADVVAAWEQAEALRQQLRHKDADLQSALEALAAAQAGGSVPSSMVQHQESGGQQLARFLKDQLAMRDEELAAAQDEAARLRQQLGRRDQELAASKQGVELTQAALADAQAAAAMLRSQQAVLQQELAAAKSRAEEEAEAANYARLETEEARREAAAQVQQLRSELWALEACANLASYGTPGDSGWQEHEGSISLQQPGTAFHSVGDADDPAVDGPAAAAVAAQGRGAEEVADDDGNEEDVFSSPMMSHLRAASSSPEQPKHQQTHSPAQMHAQVHADDADSAAGGATHSPSGFQFHSRLAPHGGSGRAAAAAADDGASSGGESEVTVSEAAVVARTLTRASALQKDREHLRQQVSDLSFELRDLKGKQKQVAQHMQAAHEEGAGSAPGGAAGTARGQPLRRPLQQQGQARQRAAGAGGEGGGDVALAEQCRLALVEERHLRSEVEMLNRKCEKGNEMLLKANHAMKILHYKLQKERKAVGRLQDEKCTLQAQLLSGGGGGGGDPRQLAALLQELQAGRSRIEGLLEEKASLAARLESVATGGRSSSREQREAAAATLAVLQQQQEAASAALREELGAERARSAAAQEERALLEGRLQEAMGRLSAAEQISGHLDLMNAYLQEERQRCQQLASLLGREQQGSESQAAEVGRLSALAHQSIDDVMAAREAAQQEHSRAEQLLREKALLDGKVEALQETLQRLEKSDDVLLRLTEDKATLQGQLRDSQAAAERAAASAEARSRQAAELEATCQELRGQLDAAVAQHDVAHAAVEGAADQLQSLTASHEGLERQLAATAADLEAAQAEAAQRAQQARQLEQQAAALEAELRQGLQQRDAALSQLQDLHRQLGAAQQEAAAQHQVAADRQLRLEAAAAEQEGLVAQLRDLEARNSNLTQNLKALEAECEAVQRLGSSVDHTNQTLVDNMCDMSGLVDAVQALQQRNRLLQQDLDTLKGRYAELHSKHEAQADLLHTTEEQRAAVSQQHKDLQVAHEVLQEEASSLQSQLSVAQAQRDQAAQQHKAAEQELGGLLERCSVAEASLADSRRLAEQAAEQHKQAAASVADLQQQLGEACQQAAAGAEEAQELARQRDELQGQFAAMEKAQSVAEGKLVLSRQREANFKEASKQLKVLQGELKSFVAESQLHRQRRDAAEQRCEELETRCLDLEQQAQRSAEQLAAADQERELASARQMVLQEQLDASRLCVARLEAQQGAFQSVQQQVNELESEQHTAAEWFDALTAELTDKTDQLAALEAKLTAAGEQQAEAALHHATAAAQLAEMKQQVDKLVAGKEQAEVAHSELSGVLESAQRQLAEAQELLSQRQQELDGAEGVAAEVSVQLVLMQASREAAEAALAEAQQAACAAQHTCGELHQQLAATQASNAATQAEQLQRIEQLHQGLFVMAAVHVSAVRQFHAAATAASQQQDAAMAAVQEEHEAALDAMAQQQAAAASEADQQRQQQAAALDACVADLRARLEAAEAAHQAAMDQCLEVQAELAGKAELAADFERQLAEASAQRDVASAARDAAERCHQQAVADGAAHQRHAELADEQCAVLREQLSFLQDQLQSESAAADVLKAAVAKARADSSSLQQQLAAAQQAAAGAADEQQRLHEALESAGEAQQAAQRREAELRLELASSAAAAQQAQQAAEQAQHEAERGVEQSSQAGRQADQLRQQLEVEEERRRALEQRLDSAWAEREQLLAKAQIHDGLETLSSRLESQLDLLRQFAFDVPVAPTAAETCAADSTSQPLALRPKLLSEVLEKLQAVQAATQQLWSFLEERLSAGSSSAYSGGGGASTESSRSNRYVAQLEARQVQLTTQLSAARQEQGEAATRLAAAQTSIATLQAAVQRLAAAGGGTAGVLADVALLGPASPEPSSGLWATAGACARQQQQQLQQQQPSDGGAASQHSGVDSGASWRQEKRLLKSICKLALAVTMDHVAGRHEAAALAAELDPLMDGHAATLHSLGLHKVWASLRTLALFGGSSGRAAQQQQPAAAVSEQQQLPREVWALQQRVLQYKSRCKELKATVVAMEGAAARWQAQAGDVEQSLTTLRLRLTDLLREVLWALEDYSGGAGADGSNAAAWEDPSGTGQLAHLVEQLAKGLRRILRKYSTLSGHVFEQSDDDAHQQYVHQQQYEQHQYMHDFSQHPGQESPTKHGRYEQRQRAGAHRNEWQEVSSAGGLSGDGGAVASQASSWAIGAGRLHGRGSLSASDPSSGCGGATASEAMAEAGRKAASIAAKLDGLLTPQSRAAVHGAGAPTGAWKSRFAPAGAAGQAGRDPHNVGEDYQYPGCSDLQATYASPRQQQLWQLPAGDPEEVPLHTPFKPSSPPF